MKLFCLVFVAFVAGVCAQSSDSNEQVKKVYIECIKETGVDGELVKKAKHGVFTEDDLLKKTILCAYKKLHLFTEDGTFNEQFIRGHVKPHYSPEQWTKIKTCFQTKTTPEDTAYYFSKCKWEQTH